jgi:hypothetical protein
MPTLTVPRSRKPIAEATATLGQREQEVLLKALRASGPAARPKVLSDLAISGPDSPENSRLRDAVEFITEVEAARIAVGISVEQAALDVSRSDVFEASPTDRERLSALLKLALPIASVKVTAKAWGLMVEVERNLHEARVVSDLRPVFGDKVDEEPVAWLIVHSLKLTVHEGRDMREIFVGIDSDDIEELADLLDREVKKARALRNSLARTGVPEAVAKAKES